MSDSSSSSIPARLCLSLSFPFFRWHFCRISLTNYCCFQFLNKNWTSMSANWTLPPLSGLLDTHTLLFIFISYFNRKFLASVVASRFSIDPKVSDHLSFDLISFLKSFETPEQLYLCIFDSVFFDVKKLMYWNFKFLRVKLPCFYNFNLSINLNQQVTDWNIEHIFLSVECISLSEHWKVFFSDSSRSLNLACPLFEFSFHVCVKFKVSGVANK